MRNEDLDDVQLMKRIAQDDHEAFAVLYQRYSRQLFVFAAYKLRSNAQAEEVVQDLFLKLWEKRQTIKISRSGVSYLFGMLRNGVVDQLRQVKAVYTIIEELADHEAVATAQADDDLYYQQLSESLKAFIDELPEKCREIFLLSRDQEMSIQQIAQHLELSDQTVKNQITKALSVLRYKLGNSVILWMLLNLYRE